MPFSFEERPNSRQKTSNPPSLVMEYVADGEVDQAVVTAFAHAATPGIQAVVEGILYKQDLKVAPQGHKLFYVTVPYGPRKYETGSYRFTFDTTGGTIAITNSKQHIARFPTTAQNYFGAINVKENNDVEGTTIVIPAGRFNYHVKHPQAVITEAHGRYLCSITGMVNSDTWHGFQPGEALFLGATGSDGTDVEGEVQYSVAYSKNASGLTIGDIAGITKKGHELAWIAYKDYEDTTSDPGKTLPGKKPKAVYIERVYDTIAFGQALGF